MEAVCGDIFWSSGLPSQFAESTNPEFYIGRNELGNVLESVRADLMREVILSRRFDIDINSGLDIEHKCDVDSREFN